MTMRFHPSLEGAQHGGKSLEEFVRFASDAGCGGCQPSNFHLTDKSGNLLTAKVVTDVFQKYDVKLDAVSAHCPFWVMGTAWTASKTIRPFIPADVAKKSPEQIEQWTENYVLQLLQLVYDLKLKVVPMFWGVYYGWELATGYPWGFYQGPEYDLLKEGDERFFQKTQKVRELARNLGISLAHEIHPGTAFMCADDFLRGVKICDGDKSLGVNADPSHCWEGEDWVTRFTKVGEYVTGCHVKDHVVWPGLPLRSMEPNWQKRAMQFTVLGEGQIDLRRYAQLMLKIGYADRYCTAHGTKTAPLVGEAESAFYDLDYTSADACGHISQNLCRPLAAGSFEKGMGEVEG